MRKIIFLLILSSMYWGTAHCQSEDKITDKYFEVNASFTKNGVPTLTQENFARTFITRINGAWFQTNLKWNGYENGDRELSPTYQIILGPQIRLTDIFPIDEMVFYLGLGFGQASTTAKRMVVDQSFYRERIAIFAMQKRFSLFASIESGGPEPLPNEPNQLARWRYLVNLKYSLLSPKKEMDKTLTFYTGPRLETEKGLGLTIGCSKELVYQKSYLEFWIGSFYNKSHDQWNHAINCRLTF